MRRALPVWILVGCLAAAAAAETPGPSPELSGSEFPALSAPLGSAISYQGRLEKNNALVTGSCNLIFKLYDALTGGTQIGSTVTLSNQQLTEGLFVGSLDFGPGAFDGQARWLEIQVQGPGDAGFTLLTPRQAISAAPYSLYSLNGTPSQWVNDATGISFGGNTGIGASSFNGIKLHVDSGTADANAMYIHNNNSNGWATLFIRNFGTNGWGLYDDTSARHHLTGKLAIGTTSPLAKLHVDSSGESAIIGRHLSNWVGVYGETQTGTGVWGNAVQSGVGVRGEHTPSGAIGYLGHGNGWAVVGDNIQTNTRGIMGAQNDGVVGIVHSINHIAGRFENDAVGGTALFANGIAKVKTLQILGGADLAERFESADEAEPGTVMAIDPSTPGRMRVADEPYCKRVAGVVSGAESLAAGVVLGVEEGDKPHLPIALTGRVWVKCDASAAPIRPGDLLTSSAKPGHAMAATDASRAMGAVLGKAMTALDSGTGMVLVLVSLQ